MPAKNFHVRQAAVSALRAWAKGHDYAESLVERHAQRRRLSAPDRALLQAILFGVLRNRRLLDHWIGVLRKGKLDAETRDILRVGLCQILVLDIPDHAAVNETVEVGKSPVRPLINAVLRNAIASRKRLFENTGELPPAVLHSHPDWLYKRWSKSFGKEKAISLMQWNNQPSETFFRLNPLSPTEKEIPGTPVANAPGYYRLDGKIPSEMLADGNLYIQDPATRHSVEMLAPQTGEKVLDACAAPGGKAFLIALKMESGKGLVCSDSNEKRLPRLRENLDRLSIHPDEIAVHDWTKTAPEKYHKAFDAILLDVPCSNTGVLRRRIDARWRMQPSDFESLAIIQKRIIENAIPCLKPGGRIVYSTCSIDDSENIALVSEVAERCGLQVGQSIRISPLDHGSDGAFAAVLTSG